jgi:hypothetical protein
MLKCPSDLIATDALLAEYPDARLVWTHRDPAAVMASVCTLIAAYLELFSEHVDRHELGRRELAFWVEATRRALDTRRRRPDRFHDVYQRDLDDDALDTVAGLYDAVGDELGPPARQAMGDWLDAHPRRRHGEPDYRLATFGLDVDAVRAQFRFYTDEFDVPIEEVRG